MKHYCLVVLLSFPCVVFGPLSSQTSNIQSWRSINTPAIHRSVLPFQGNSTSVRHSLVGAGWKSRAVNDAEPAVIEWTSSTNQDTFCVVIYKGYGLTTDAKDLSVTTETGQTYNDCVYRWMTQHKYMNFAVFNGYTEECSFRPGHNGPRTSYDGIWIDFNKEWNSNHVVIAKTSRACPKEPCTTYDSAKEVQICQNCNPTSYSVNMAPCQLCNLGDPKLRINPHTISVIPFSPGDMMQKKCYPNKQLVTNSTCKLPACIDCTPKELIMEPDPKVVYNTSQYQLSPDKIVQSKPICGLKIQMAYIKPLRAECKYVLYQNNKRFDMKEWYWIDEGSALCDSKKCTQDRVSNDYCNPRETCGWNITTHKAEVEECRNCGLGKTRKTVQLFKQYRCRLAKTDAIKEERCNDTTCNCTEQYEFTSDFKNVTGMVCVNDNNGKQCGKVLQTTQRRRRRSDCMEQPGRSDTRKLPCPSELCNCPTEETYGMWNFTEPCNVTCGYGMRERTRTKNVDCVGEEKQTEVVQCIEPLCDCTDDSAEQRLKNEWSTSDIADASCTSTTCGINVTYVEKKINKNRNCKTSTRNETKICRNVKPCKCLENHYTKWTKWSSCQNFNQNPPVPPLCDQTGEQRRTQNVEDEKNPQDCENPKTQSKPCGPLTCCPQDCVWDSWDIGYFFPLGDDGALYKEIWYKIRRKKVEESCGGKCEGESFFLKPFKNKYGNTNWKQFPAYSLWPRMNPSYCASSAITCNANRTVLLWRQPITTYTQKMKMKDKPIQASCRGQWCPEACTWAEWSRTSQYPCAACKRSSVPVPTEPRSETFSREIKRNATFGGEDCYSSDGSDTRECNKTFCKEPCKYSDWIKVDQCTGKCWSGFTYKYRRVEQAATANGACSEDVIKTSECTQQQANDCPMDDVCRNFLKNSDDSSTLTSCMDEDEDEKLCMYGKEPRFKTKSRTRYSDLACSQDFKLDEQLCNDKAKLPCSDKSTMYLEGLSNSPFKCVYTPWLAWACQADCSGQLNGQVVQGKGTRKRFLIYGGGGKFPGNWNCTIDDDNKTLGVQTEDKKKDCQVVCKTDATHPADDEDDFLHSSEESGVKGWHIGVMVAGIVLVLLSIALCIAIVVFRRKAHKTEHPGKTKVVIQRKRKESPRTASSTPSTISRVRSRTSSTLTKPKSTEKGAKSTEKVTFSGRLSGFFGNKKQKQAKQARKQKGQKQSKPGWKRKEEEAMSRKDVESEKSITMRTEKSEPKSRQKTLTKTAKNKESKPRKTGNPKPKPGRSKGEKATKKGKQSQTTIKTTRKK